MSVHLHIHLQSTCQTDTHIWANIDYLCGYTSESITAYRELAEKMKNLLPGLEKELIEDNIRCGKVIKSDYCDRFSSVTWDGWVSKANFEKYKALGWRITERNRDYYLA